MKRVFLMALGLLLLCFPLVGCDSEEALDSAEIESIITEVSTSTSEVDTITFDMEISADVGIEGEGVSMEASVDGSSEGSIDIENEEMYIPIDIEATIPGLGDESISLEMYVVDGWMYMNMDDDWTKMEVPAELSEMQDQSELIGQLTGLMDLVEIEDKGSETVNGVDCYKFQVSPDMGDLVEYVIEQFQQEGMEDFNLEDLGDIEDLKDILSAFTVDCTFWISQEDNLLMKVDLDLSGDISSQDIPDLDTGAFGSLDINLNAQIEFEYDQPVDIELPEEALDAYYSGDFDFPF